MSTIEKSLLNNPLFDPNIITHELLPMLPARETSIFLNAVAANPRLRETEHAPGLSKMYKDSTLRQLKNNTPSEALRIAVQSKNYLLLKELLKPGAAFDAGYTLDDAFQLFAKRGNQHGLEMILQSGRRGELVNIDHAFQDAHPALIPFLLDPANHVNVSKQAVTERLIIAGRYQAPEDGQVIEAILSAPGIGNVIGDQFFRLANNGWTRGFFRALDRHLELFAPSFERMENMSKWSFCSSGILKHAREFNCFNILREVIENQHVNHIERNNDFHSIYLVSTEWLEDCAARCAEAGHAELSQQFRTTIANRNRTCTKISFAVEANVLPKLKTLAARAREGDLVEFLYALDRCLGLER